MGTAESIYQTFVYLRIVEATIGDLEATLTLILIESGIWICAASIFANLRLFSILPLGVFVMFPFFTIVTLGIAQQLLPALTNIHENSETALTKWMEQLRKNENVGGDQRYLRRKFLPLRPIRFKAGFNGFTFFVLDKSTKTYFLGSVLDNAINLLMAIPELG